MLNLRIGDNCHKTPPVQKPCTTTPAYTGGCSRSMVTDYRLPVRLDGWTEGQTATNTTEGT